MKIIKMQFTGPDLALQYLLELPMPAGAQLNFGTVLMPRGCRQPREGVSRHGGEEVSLILKGRAAIECGGRRIEVGPGDLVHIEAEEAHVTEALEECHVYFALSGDASVPVPGKAVPG
jgi:mannose-6-phosphate isomerase-like protein (cupin superfamily)